MSFLRQHKVQGLLVAVLALLGALVVVNAGMAVARLAAGVPASQVLEGAGMQTTLWLAGPGGADSWKPMAQAYLSEQRGESPYRVFFGGENKYQYPPSALLLFDLLPEGAIRGPESVVPGSRFNDIAGWLSRLAVLGTLAVSSLLLLVAAPRSAGVRLFSTQGVVIAGSFGVAGLFFYPLMYAHELGQIQVFLNFLLATALLLWALGWRAAAGVLVGLCALVKPQYAAALLWMAIARQWPAAIAMVAVGATGLLLSLARFGLDSHLEYLEVLRHLARSGEAFWPNQSMNGLVNRLLGNGDALTFSSSSLPPYSAVVHAATLASSLLIIAVSLATAWRQRKAGAGDTLHGFGVILAGLTLASPVAWEHHYGFFIALVAALLPWASAGTGRQLRLAALVLATLAVATTFKFLQAGFGPLLQNPLSGLLLSHMYVGGLVIFAMLVRASWSTRDAST